jgi:hypothetical protein
VKTASNGQMSSYGSTPAHRGLHDHHGQRGLQETLDRMSKQGRWKEMMGLVSDGLCDETAASSTPRQVAAKLRSRNGFADRTTLVLYDETDADAPVERVRTLRA